MFTAVLPLCYCASTHRRQSVLYNSCVSNLQAVCLENQCQGQHAQMPKWENDIWCSSLVGTPLSWSLAHWIPFKTTTLVWKRS